MTERFEQFFIKLMGYEGGLGNDAADHGGLTNYGISKKVYPDLIIENLTKNQAKLLYYKDYYRPLQIDGIRDEKTAWHLFDFGVNAGISRAAKTLQKILGTTQDGIIGNNTLLKANTWAGKYPLHIHYVSERMKFYFRLTENDQTQLKFLRGWLVRVFEIPTDL